MNLVETGDLSPERPEHAVDPDFCHVPKSWDTGRIMRGRERSRNSLDQVRLQNPGDVSGNLTGRVITDEFQRQPDRFPLRRILADRKEKPAPIWTF